VAPAPRHLLFGAVSQEYHQETAQSWPISRLPADQERLPDLSNTHNKYPHIVRNKLHKKDKVRLITITKKV